MATRWSARIVAANAKLHTGNEKATRYSARIAEKKKVQVETAKVTGGSQSTNKQPVSRVAKKSKARRPQVPSKGQQSTTSKKGRGSKKTTATQRLSAGGRSTSQAGQVPHPYEDISIASNHLGSNDAPGGASHTAPRELTQESEPDGVPMATQEDAQPLTNNDGPVALERNGMPVQRYYGDGRPSYRRYPDIPDDEGGEEAFFQAVYAGVVVQRAVRRRQAQLRECRRRVRDARFMIEQHHMVLTNLNPVTQMDWLASRHFRAEIAEWAPILEERLEEERRVLSYASDLDERLRRIIRELEGFQELWREHASFMCLANNVQFWDTFDLYQTTVGSLRDIDAELTHVEERREAFDRQIRSGCRRHLELLDGDEDLMISELGEIVTFREMEDIPLLVRSQEELDLRKEEATTLLIKQATRLLAYAEEAFVECDMLEKATEDSDQEGPEENQPGDPDEPEDQDQREDQHLPAVPSPGPQEKQKALNDELQAAKADCQKARDDFDEARSLTQEEIQQLPQPVTAHDLGIASFLKLGRLTSAWRHAEDVYDDVLKRARDAGATDGKEQTSQFADHPDDGDDDQAIIRAAEKDRHRVEGWNGLYEMDPQSVAAPLRAPSGSRASLGELQSVRVGEDSFECTEATDKIREKIDMVRTETNQLRNGGDFPAAEKDSLVLDMEE